MGENIKRENPIKSSQRIFFIISLVFILISILFSVLTALVSLYFIFIIVLNCLAVIVVFYFINKKQHEDYKNLILKYSSRNKEMVNQEAGKPVNDEKYKFMLKLVQSSQEILKGINDQIREYISLKKTDLEKVAENQRNLIHENEDIMNEIQKKNSTFSSENNIVKELIKNIAEKVDSEIGFSRNTLDRLKNLFHIITEIIKASEILYKNSEFLVSIMQTIENISNKIHVLSINASVIAARAGEAGKSFMVVAKEVRNLSDNVKKSVDEMKNNSDKLKTSIDEVTENIQEIESETKTTYEDMENLLMRFEGLNLSINIIDKKIIANMDIIKNFESLIRTNIKNNNEYAGLLDSINMEGLGDAINLIEQAKQQFTQLENSAAGQ